MKQYYSINWLKEKIEAEENLKFIFFWGHANKYNEEVGKFCFSQWYESPFIVESVLYTTSEHWMMAQKAKLFNDQKIFKKIISSDKPGEVKELGRQVVGFNETKWNENRFEIVKQGNIHKFTQNPKLEEYLLKTENRILVEASPVDTIWGIGLTQDSKDINNVNAWRGLNLLGFALMEARDFILKKKNVLDK